MENAISEKLIGLELTNSEKSNVSRVLLDVTIAATTSIHTGIQRVVRNITRECEQLSQEMGVECVPVVCLGDQLTKVGFDGRKRLDERCFDLVRNSFQGMQTGIAKCLGLLHSRLGTGYPNLLSRLRKLFVPKTPLRLLKNFYFGLTRQKVTLRENDLLVLLDASWNLPIEKLVGQADSAGAQIGTVIYDLIPVNYPEFHDEALKQVFRNWLDQVVDASSFFIGISDTVKDELIDYASKRLNGDLSGKQFGSFRLGADFSSVLKEARVTSKASQRFQSLTNFYLTVGTIEPRKNHEFLLDAFDEIWKTNPNVQLCIVGKVGWMCDSVMKRITEHPLRNHALFFYDNVSDQELNQLYAKAKSLVFPSIVEGFGLPIVEALHHQTPVLASDTKIHREVGQDECIYFGLDKTQDLVQTIRSVEEGELQLKQPEYQPVSWRESCREFLSKVIRFSESAYDQKIELEKAA